MKCKACKLGDINPSTGYCRECGRLNYTPKKLSGEMNAATLPCQICGFHKSARMMVDKKEGNYCYDCHSKLWERNFEFCPKSNYNVTELNRSSAIKEFYLKPKFYGEKIDEQKISEILWKYPIY